VSQGPGETNPSYFTGVITFDGQGNATQTDQGIFFIGPQQRNDGGTSPVGTFVEECHYTYAVARDGSFSYGGSCTATDGSYKLSGDTWKGQIALGGLVLLTNQVVTDVSTLAFPAGDSISQYRICGSVGTIGAHTTAISELGQRGLHEADPLFDMSSEGEPADGWTLCALRARNEETPRSKSFGSRVITTPYFSLDYRSCHGWLTKNWFWHPPVSSAGRQDRRSLGSNISNARLGLLAIRVPASVCPQPCNAVLNAPPQYSIWTFRTGNSKPTSSVSFGLTSISCWRICGLSYIGRPVSSRMIL
jgi:hypothetical protein